MQQQVFAQIINQTIGETGGDQVVAVTSYQNNWIIGGTFQHSLNQPSIGNSDVFLQQYDDDGQLQWQYNIGSTKSDLLHAMTTDALGAIYTTGMFSDTLLLETDTMLYAPVQTVFIVKHNQQGQLEWARMIESQSVVLIEKMITDANGNVYLTGAFQDSLMLDSIALVGQASKTVFVAKMNAQGHFLWAKKASYNARDSEGIALAVDHNSQVYLAGNFRDYFTFEQDTFQAHPAFTDIFLVQLDSNGNVLKEQAFGGVYNNVCTALKWHNNALYLAGNFEGVLDIGNTRLITAFRDLDGFVAKLYADGSTAWASQSLTQANCQVEDIVLHHQLIAVVGNYADTLAWGSQYAVAIDKNEAFLLYLDNQGVAQQLMNWRGKGFDLAKGIAINEQDEVAVVGTFQDTIVFLDTILVANGLSDGFFRVQGWLNLPSSTIEPVYQLVEFRIIPNPIVDAATIDLADDVVLEEWFLFNTNGQVVAQGNAKQISLSRLKSGTYSLQIRTNQGMGIGKIIKQ